MTQIFYLDTTLRDGAQTEGVSFSVSDKLNIARALDRFGIDYIEGGFPGANPKDEEFFRRAEKLTWRSAKLTAFGATRYKGSNCENDPCGAGGSPFRGAGLCDRRQELTFPGAKHPRDGCTRGVWQ